MGLSLGLGAWMRASGLLLSAWLSAGTALAQTHPPATAEARLLAQGWSALAGGDQKTAARVAADLTRDHSTRPSVAVLAFVVEAGIAGDGSQAGLTAYERWLGSRRLEDAYALRRIAAALLRETADDEGLLRMQALAALSRDDDPVARGELAAAVARGDAGAILAAAAAGHVEAVDALAQQLGSAHAGHDRVIRALGESGQPGAIPPLTAMLSSDRHELVELAARALGNLGAREAIPDLWRLLDHYYPAVRLAAAEALYRMNEDSGRQVLQTFASSEYPGVRIGAAQAMASRPDAEWETLVRGLIGEDDPVIRLQAARLLAPHDAKLAGETLSALMQDANPAVREAAGLAAASADTADFAALRRLLRGPDQRTQVQAAGRILALTR